MNLLDFQHRFPKEKSCREYLILTRWPEGITCPGCDGKGFDFLKTRKVFECKTCHKHVSATAGTIFDKTRIPLRKWFWAIFLMATSKKGVSMLYLQKQLKIKSYRATWLMGQKIRQAMTQRDALYGLKDRVSADEIFIGGKQSKIKKKTLGTNKTPFLIMVEENDKSKPRFVSFEELESIFDEHIVAGVRKRVRKGVHLTTDGAFAYVVAAKDNYYDHERRIYMNEPLPTQERLRWVNTLTGNLKRFLISTYHGVGRKYRKAYLAEFAYRFNRRYWPDQAFDRLVRACIYSKPAPLPVLKA